MQPSDIYSVPIEQTRHSNTGERRRAGVTMTTFKKHIRQAIAISLVWNSATFAATCLELPQSSPVPGGVVVLDVGSTEMPAPEVEYQGRRVMVVEDCGKWRAIVGIPLSVEPGKQLVKTRRGDE